MTDPRWPHDNHRAYKRKGRNLHLYGIQFRIWRTALSFDMVLHIVAPLVILAARELVRKVNQADVPTTATHSNSVSCKYDPQPELKGSLHLEGNYDSDDEGEDKDEDEVTSLLCYSFGFG